MLFYKNYIVYQNVYMFILSELEVAITSPSFVALYLMVHPVSTSAASVAESWHRPLLLQAKVSPVDCRLLLSIHRYRPSLRHLICNSNPTHQEYLRQTWHSRGGSV